METKKSKRCLFGKPEPNVVDDFLKDGLKKIQDEKAKEVKKKYGVPLGNKNSKKSSISACSKVSDFLKIVK